MSTLHDTVVLYGTDQTLMADLANSCGIGSTQAAARAYDVALSAVLDGFSDTADMNVGATLLHTLAARLSRTERSHPGTLFASPDHPLRRAVADQVFGSALPSVRADVARTSGLGTADRLIEITSLVCLAVAAGPGETAVGIPAFVAAVGAAGAVSVPTATPTPAASTPTFAAPSPGTAPVSVTLPLAASPGNTNAPDAPSVVEAERSRWPWLLAAAAVVLLLIGAIAVLSGDDDAGDTEVAPVTDATAEAADEGSVAAVPAADVPEPVPAEPAKVTPSKP